MDEALRLDPNETTSLGLVGIAAFENQRFQDAIDAWTRLAKGLDPQDPSYAAIQTGIERARAALANSPQAAASNASPLDAAADNDYQLAVEVALADALLEHVAATDTVYVFARAENGPPMPIAAKRLTVADLPVRITLTDADSLLPDLKLSSMARVKLQASVSNTDNAMNAQWSSEPIVIDATEEDGKHALLIDQKN